MILSDSELVEMLREPRTRREGFAVLVKQYSEKLYWKVRRIVLSHEDANDVLQNVFIKVWSNLQNFQGKSSLSTWLYRIAVNESLDFLRKQKLADKVSTDEDDSVASRLMSDEYFDGDEVQTRLQEAVARLPEVQRTVFSLKYFEEMKYSEISQIINTSEGALKASYQKKKKKITEYLHLFD